MLVSFKYFIWIVKLMAKIFIEGGNKKAFSHKSMFFCNFYDFNEYHWAYFNHLLEKKDDIQLVPLKAQLEDYYFTLEIQVSA